MLTNAKQIYDLCLGCCAEPARRARTIKTIIDQANRDVGTSRSGRIRPDRLIMDDAQDEPEFAPRAPELPLICWIGASRFVLGGCPPACSSSKSS